MSDASEITPKPNESYALRWTVETISRRHDAVAKAWSFYQGKQTEVFANERVAAELRRYGRKFRLNMARTPVSAVINRLEIESIELSDGQDRWDQLVANQAAMATFHDAFERAEAMGESMILAWPTEAVEREVEEGEDAELATIEIADDVTLILEDPRGMAVKYDDEVPTLIEYAGRMWTTGTGERRVNIYYDDRVVRWVEDSKGSNTFKRMEAEDDDAEAGEWLYPDSMEGVPVFHFRTDTSPHGRPGHEDAMPVQSMLDKLVATDMSIVDFQGYPTRWAVAHPDKAPGFADPEVDEDDGTETMPDDPGGNLKSGPGQFWWLDAAKVGQFEAADAEQTLSRMDFYIRALLGVTDTPLTEWEGAGSNLSGKARREADKPLVRKVGRRQELHGARVSGLVQYVMRALGLGDVEVSIDWADAAEVDEEDAWTLTGLKVTAGLPLAQALREIGYTPDQLEGMGITDDVEFDPERIARLVSSIANAVPAVMDQADARALLAALGLPIDTEADPAVDDPEVDLGE